LEECKKEKSRKLPNANIQKSRKAQNENMGNRKNQKWKKTISLNAGKHEIAKTAKSETAQKWKSLNS